MIPDWKYGNGWVHHVDFGDVVDSGHWDVNQAGACWAELCRYADTIAHVRFQTFAPRDLQPGYFSRTRVMRPGWWNDPNAGLTPRNAWVWNDPYVGPYCFTPENYVTAPGSWSPPGVAHAIVHELGHLLFPYGQNSHNTDVGNIFSPDMGPDASILPEFGKRIGDSVWHLVRGYRVLCLSNMVVIPDPSPTGKYPESFGHPPAHGPTTRIDGKVLDLTTPVLAQNWK